MKNDHIGLTIAGFFVVSFLIFVLLFITEKRQEENFLKCVENGVKPELCFKRFK